jgi:hypothetical protein
MRRREGAYVGGPINAQRGRQRAYQDLGDPMGPQVIQDCIAALDSRGTPHPPARGSSPRGRSALRHRRAYRRCRGPPCPSAHSRSPAWLGQSGSVRHWGPRGWGRSRGAGDWAGQRHQLGQSRGGRARHPWRSRTPLGALRSPLIRPHADTPWGRRRVERREAPLCATKANTTRWPNKARARNPRALRPRGVQPIERPESPREPHVSGGVRRVAATALTGARGDSAWRAACGCAAKLVSPWPWRCWSQRRTVVGVSCRSWAMAGTRWPWWARPTIQVRRKLSTAPARMARARHAMGHLLWQRPQMVATISRMNHLETISITGES